MLKPTSNRKTPQEVVELIDGDVMPAGHFFAEDDQINHHCQQKKVFRISFPPRHKQG
jgi:hypothetical protein